MSLPIADRWFEHRRIDDNISLLWEPHVVALMRCNIWHVKGRDRDLIIDTGMGVVSLVDAMKDFLDKPVTAIATHGHADHIGSHHEFDEVLAHPAEAAELEHPSLTTLDPIAAWGVDFVEELRGSGDLPTDPLLVSAMPPGYQLDSYSQAPARVTQLIDEGDVVDIGHRQFEILHLPGHSPGSIGLWEASTGTLFSGDAVYDGQLLDELPGSDVPAYCSTMRRLLELPVNVVHGGHDPSFGRQRLRTIARAYLEQRA